MISDKSKNKSGKIISFINNKDEKLNEEKENLSNQNTNEVKNAPPSNEKSGKRLIKFFPIRK